MLNSNAKVDLFNQTAVPDDILTFDSLIRRIWNENSLINQEIDRFNHRSKLSQDFATAYLKHPRITVFH